MNRRSRGKAAWNAPSRRFCSLQCNRSVTTRREKRPYLALPGAIRADIILPITVWSDPTVRQEAERCPGCSRHKIPLTQAIQSPRVSAGTAQNGYSEQSYSTAQVDFLAAVFEPMAGEVDSRFFAGFPCPARHCFGGGKCGRVLGAGKFIQASGSDENA